MNSFEPVQVLLCREHVIIISGAVLFMFALLEWRSSKWPRYRRATLGFVVFLLNLVVLISIFMMILTATVAAPALLHHAR